MEWHETANDRLAKHPDYHAFAARIEESLVGVETAAEAYNTLVSEAYAALSTVEPPAVHVPSAELASGFLDEPILHPPTTLFPRHGGSRLTRRWKFMSKAPPTFRRVGGEISRPVKVSHKLSKLRSHP